MNNKFVIVFLMLSLFSLNSEANKISQKTLDLEDDPTSGKTLAVGILHENIWGSQYIYGERGWTFFPSKFYLVEGFSPYITAKKGKDGERYLFYSLGETSGSGMLKNSAYVGLAPLKSKKAKDVIVKLANKNDFIGEINPSWQYCESDNECIQSKNQCENLIGINKKYEKDYLSFLKIKKLKVDCTKEGASKSGDSKCVENFCS